MSEPTYALVVFDEFSEGSSVYLVPHTEETEPHIAKLRTVDGCYANSTTCDTAQTDIICDVFYGGPDGTANRFAAYREKEGGKFSKTLFPTRVVVTELILTGFIP